MRHARGRFLARGLEADQRPGRVAAVQVVRVQPLAHVGQRQDAQRQRAAVPVGPDPATVAGDPTPQVGDAIHQHRRYHSQQLAQGEAQSLEAAVRRPARQRRGQRAFAHRGRREQHVAVEVVQFGHMHVHTGGGVGLRDGEHLAPVAALAVSLQRRSVVLRGRVVTLELEAGQARQRVQFALGPRGEIAFQQR